MAYCTRLFALLATCVLVAVNAAPYLLSQNGDIASLTPAKWSGFKCHNADDLRCEDRVCQVFPNGKECCLCKELLPTIEDR